MPTYRYKCKKCDHVFTERHKIKENITDCPQKDCNGKVKKVIGFPTVRFYGKGFTKGGVYNYGGDS